MNCPACASRKFEWVGQQAIVGGVSFFKCRKCGFGWNDEFAKKKERQAKRFAEIRQQREIIWARWMRKKNYFLREGCLGCYWRFRWDRAGQTVFMTWVRPLEEILDERFGKL